MLFSLLMACWMDSSTLPALNINVINFTNEYLEADVEVRIYDSPLLCPDGLPASFFLVLPKSDAPLPVSVIFHSGAMAYSDYVEDPDAKELIEAMWLSVQADQINFKTLVFW